MFSCQICGAVNLPSLGMLLSHIKLMHACEPGFTVQCDLQGCKRTFRNFSTFRNHLYNFHEGAMSVVDSSTLPVNVGSYSSADTDESDGDDTDQEDIGVFDDSTGRDVTNVTEEMLRKAEDRLQRAAALWILKTRETHKIPQSVMDGMVVDLGSLFQCALAGVSCKIQRELKQHEVSDEVVKIVAANMEQGSSFVDIFKELKTHHLQLKYFKQKFDLLEPVTVVLGSKLKHKGCGSKRRLVEVDETMVYVPILATLQNLLKNDAVLAEVERGHTSMEPGVLSDYCDGMVFKSHPLFSVHSDGLQIQLYYDDIEVCNPIGSHKKVHKLGAFYFMLGNIRPKYRSTYKMIHLMAFCKVSYISKYSMDIVLKPIVEDLKKLEQGHTFIVDGAPRLFYGAISVVSADNPASSALGGYKESSSALHFCRQCLGTSEETATKFNESDFTLRELSVHLQQCDILESDLSDSDRVEKSKMFGINRRSVFLELQYFDVCSGVLIPDVMHDLLEGVLPYEAKLVLQHCIMGKKYLTYETFSQRLEEVELGYMESDDRPTMITKHALTSHEKNLGQKAAQMGLLGRLLPMLIAEDVPTSDNYWKNFLLLREIIELILAPELSEDEIAHLQLLIEEHHCNFISLYPSHSVTPKIHAMIHIPRLMIKFGPMLRYWTMRFEAKHNHSKKLAQNLGNFINIAWTLASRHQQWNCYQWLNTTIIGQEEPEVGPGDDVAEHDRPSELQSSSSCYRCRWVKVNGITYKPTCAIVYNIVDDEPIFGKVKDIYITDGNRVVFEVQKMKTKGFKTHYHAYIVQSTNNYSIILLHMLISPFPLHIRRLHSELIIIMKHHIIGTLQV